MDWFIFAIIASMIWPFGNIVDKIFLTKHVKNPFSYQILCGLTNGLMILFFPLFVPISIIFPWFILGIVCSLMGWSIFIIYNKAVMTEEISRVVPLMYLSAIFLLPLAIFFLNEVLGLSKYVGIVLLVLGAILISYKKIDNKKGKISSAVKLLLLFDLLMAIYGISLKYMLGFMDHWSLLFWVNFGGMLGGFLFLSVSRIRNNFLNDMKKLGRKGLVFRYLGVSAYYLGIIPYYIALSLGPVSLVSGVNSIQPFFVFLYATIISLFIPKIIREKIDKTTLILKLIAVCLIFIGTWFIVT
jgi:uncharacterized membrane protein